MKGRGKPMKINKNFFFGCVVTFFVWIILSYFGYDLNFFQTTLVFLMSYPWTLKDGNVASLFGGFSERSITSFVGIIQIADQDTKAVLGIIQIAKRNVFSFFGFTILQKAEGDIDQIINLFALVQYAKKDINQFVSLITIYQKSFGKDISEFINIFVFYQIAERDITQTVSGITVFQICGCDIEQEISIVTIVQKAAFCNDTGFGAVTIIQTAENINQNIGIVFYRNAEKLVICHLFDIVVISVTNCVKEKETEVIAN